MIRYRVYSCALTIALLATLPRLSLAEGRESCPVTKPPSPAFVPPAPYPEDRAPGQFLYGSPSLWVAVRAHWSAQPRRKAKLLYFRQGYDAVAEPNPRLSVVARRLDKPDPLVWAPPVRSINVDHTAGNMFMASEFNIPASGCWEVSAHYEPAADKAETLTFTVWVEP